LLTAGAVLACLAACTPTPFGARRSGPARLDLGGAGSVEDDVDGHEDVASSASARSCKRGIAYGEHSTADLQALATGISWWSNWSDLPDFKLRGEDLDGVEHAPMVWGKDFDPATVEAHIAASTATGTRYLQGFNEPNFFEQANLSAEDAAALWPKLEAIADARDLRLVSPAVNFCGGGCHDTDPAAYLRKFFAACEGCRVDVVAVHSYTCRGEFLRQHLEGVEAFGKPVWLTEFACGDIPNASVEDQALLLREALPLLEGDPQVERYAWFTGRATNVSNASLLDGDGELTALGKQYVSAAGDACAE
jgi:hypothetical protein